MINSSFVTEFLLVIDVFAIQLHEILPNYVQSAFGKYKCHTLVKYIEQSE